VDDKIEEAHLKRLVYLAIVLPWFFGGGGLMYTVWRLLTGHPLAIWLPLTAFLLFLLVRSWRQDEMLGYMEAIYKRQTELREERKGGANHG